jgi:hypothetical protein
VLIGDFTQSEFPRQPFEDVFTQSADPNSSKLRHAGTAAIYENPSNAARLSSLFLGFALGHLHLATSMVMSSCCS